VSDREGKLLEDGPFPRSGGRDFQPPQAGARDGQAADRKAFGIFHVPQELGFFLRRLSLRRCTALERFIIFAA
jgi:hypothetical protein